MFNVKHTFKKGKVLLFLSVQGFPLCSIFFLNDSRRTGFKVSFGSNYHSENSTFGELKKNFIWEVRFILPFVLSVTYVPHRLIETQV